MCGKALPYRCASPKRSWREAGPRGETRQIEGSERQSLSAHRRGRAAEIFSLRIAMTDDETKTVESKIEDLDQNELAHSIIEALLDHTRVVSDLIALMAQALDQDTTRALTLTPQWQAYLESRRRMETTRAQVEQFVEISRRPPED